MESLFEMDVVVLVVVELMSLVFLEVFFFPMVGRVLGLSTLQDSLMCHLTVCWDGLLN